jgi:hypothetical protein
VKENFGQGWVDRGPRTAVKAWDDDMQSCKGEKEIDSRMFGHSEIDAELVTG